MRKKTKPEIKKKPLPKGKNTKKVLTKRILTKPAVQKKSSGISKKSAKVFSKKVQPKKKVIKRSLQTAVKPKVESRAAKKVMKTKKIIVQKLQIKSRKKTLATPKTYLSINKKLYRAIEPDKALAIAKKLSSGLGDYKVHVIYGKEQVSKRKVLTIENEGKFKTAKEAKQAIEAFLDQSLWLQQ